MDNAIATTQTNTGVAPPSLVETVTPAANPISPNAVASVNLEYPERFKSIVSNASANTPDSRLKLAQDIVSHDKETEAYNANQKPQWGKVFAALANSDFDGALKWYNGGGVKEVASRDMHGNLYYKEENERGFTGKIIDREGKALTNKQMKELDARGGIFNKGDEDSLKTIPWVNGKYNSELANKGLTTQLQLATNDAYNAARTAGGANQNIDEQLHLTNNLRGVIDHISGLSPDRRKSLLGYVTRLNQINAASGTSSEKGLSANAAEQQVAGRTAGANFGGGGGTGAGEGVPPTTGKLGLGVGASTSASNQIGASGREGTGATTSNASMLQEQQNLQAAIMQELQGVIKSPAQFQEFMRLQSLNAANDAAYKNIPDHVKPPTWNTVPDTDPFTGGAGAMIANRVNQQRNNALMAAWSKELYSAQRDAAKTGKATDIDKLAEDFQKSDIFKAINNTYEYKMKSHVEGRTIRPPKGSLMVNNKNQIGMSPGE